MPQLSVVHVNTPAHPNAIRFYCGRSTSYRLNYGIDCSVLGNPFALKSEVDRAQVCNAFKKHLERKLRAGDPAIRRALHLIYKTAKTKAVELSCFCAPKQCHADTIRKLLETKL